MSTTFEDVRQSPHASDQPDDPSDARALGFGETRMHLMHTELHGTTQGATVLSVEGSIDRGALEAALSVAGRAYDILRSRIVERDQSFAFEPVFDGGSMRLTVVPRVSDRTWVELVERENSRPLPAECGLWRAFLVGPGARGGGTRSEVVLLAHHAVLDGTAASTLLRRILAEVVRPTGHWPRRRLRPPTEAIASANYTWDSFATKQAALGREVAAVRLMRHAAGAPLEERLTRVIPVVFGARTARGLDERAEKAGASSYSYLSALWLLAVSAHSADRSRFALHTAISMRSLCERNKALDRDDLGCYLSVVATVHEVPGKAADALAREHWDALYGAALRQGRTPATLDLSAMRAATRAAASRAQFTQDIGITYLEEKSEESVHGLEVKEHYITANRAAGMAAVVLHAVRRDGGLFTTVNFTSPLQGETWGMQVAETLRALLEEASAVSG